MALTCKHAFMTIGSEQFDLLVSFYRALLDQLPQVYKPQSYAEFQLPGLKLAIFKPQPGHRAEFSAKTSGSLSLCLTVDNLADAISTLTRIGYPPKAPITKASHGQEVYAYDPAGNRIILHQPH